MIEWYRRGFDDSALMTEVEDLVRAIIGGRNACRRAPSA